jgi:hypothetical protein
MIAKANKVMDIGHQRSAPLEKKSAIDFYLDQSFDISEFDRSISEDKNLSTIDDKHSTVEHKKSENN